MADWELKRNDTWPPITGRAQDASGAALPLATADQVLFLMRIPGSGTLVFGTATVIDPPDVDGNNWEYEWAAGDTTQAGTYNAELEITWTAGRVETVPNGPQPDDEPNPTGYFTVLIEEDLGV